MPKVSVVMPVYNRAGIVRRAVDSVLAQNFDDFELIVVDDGSTDATCEIVSQVGDPRVRLVCMDRNGGSNAARNRGIRESRSDLIAFLDSDDVFLPEKLGTVVTEFDDRPDLDVLVDSFTKISGDRTKARRNPVIDSTEQFRHALFARRLWKPTSAITVRKEAVIRAGLFNEEVRQRQDFELLARLSETATCASTGKILWTKYETEGCISHDTGLFIGATLQLCRRSPEYVSDPSFRRGLARDVTRHLGRSVRRMQVGRALRDATALSRGLGTLRLLQLLREGSVELVRRHREARS